MSQIIYEWILLRMKVTCASIGDGSGVVGIPSICLEDFYRCSIISAIRRTFKPILLLTRKLKLEAFIWYYCVVEHGGQSNIRLLATGLSKRWGIEFPLQNSWARARALLGRVEDLLIPRNRWNRCPQPPNYIYLWNYGQFVQWSNHVGLGGLIAHHHWSPHVKPAILRVPVPYSAGGNQSLLPMIQLYFHYLDVLECF